MCNNNGVDSLEELTSACDQTDLVAMDNSNRTDSGGVEDVPRAKFLCSFGGCVLPRPQDGKLRYVGGETRIVSVPRNVGYEELMGRMREIYDEAAILKYQQPDEDLDALVSVVNDDDVVNMMEEYDKLGSGDAFTRLRIFLFSAMEQDASPRYMDGDERDSERRYVDALNSLCESPDYRRGNSPTMGPFEDVHIVDQYLNSMNLDGSVHNQRNYEMAMAPYNLGQVHSPSVGVGQHCLPVGQLHGEDVSWSPAGYSPRYAGHHEMRNYADVGSPSYARYHMAYQEMGDRCVNRVNEEPNHQQTASQLPLDCPQPYSDQVVWLPTGPVPVDMGGFPGNMHSGPNVVDSPSVCQHCKTNFTRTPSTSDFHRKPEELSHAEQLAMRNGFSKVASTCVECHHPRTPISGVGRMGDQGNIDGPSIKFPVGPISSPDGNGVPSIYALHDDPGHIRVGGDLGGEVFHNQAMPNGSHVHIPLDEQRGVRPANFSYMQGVEIPPQLSHHGNASVWPNGRNVPAPVHVLPHDPSILPPRSGGYPYGNLSKLSSPVPLQDAHQAFSQDPLRNTPNMLHIPPSVEAPRSSVLPSVVLNDNPLPSDAGGCVASELAQSREVKILEVDDVQPPKQNSQAEKTSTDARVNADRSNSIHPGKGSKEEADCLPEQNSSAQGAKIEGAEEVKGGSRENGGAVIVENESVDVKVDSAGGSENECTEPSKIGPSKAEEEAIAKGLQTIKNADLEEVRELGTGTYGAVYHGKWRGSDVAIKRIKASCFAGRPSEIERLIADFWKEALILSSLHHPNVVSFYGVVRDGPDGSLATVTEFMINGSLKQFLRKKDRTIDRRKRVIIAMDAAFGMEYLHEKNIVHFDLKCENLLVNMRDPHRPVCKIGDLGLSKVKQHTLVSGGVRGTLPWMAPELLSGKTHMVTEKIDVYSFGIVMWELLTGEEPYSDMHCASLIGGIVNNTLRPQIPTWCDPEWKALMESCWASEPAERPSFSEISQKLRSMAAAMNIK